MRDPEVKVIGDISFEVTPLGFKQGRKAFVKLTKAVGPAISEGTTVHLDKLIDGVDDDDLEWFASVFGKATRFSKDGDKWPFLNESNREQLFQGKLVLFFEWLVFCLEVNFSDFLELMRVGSPVVDLSSKTK